MIESIKSRLQEIKTFISGIDKNETVYKDVGYLAFILGIIPVSGAQQFGQVATRQGVRQIALRAIRLVTLRLSEQRCSARLQR